MQVFVSCHRYLDLMAPVQYVAATLKVLNTYSGWAAVNSVLNNVRDPVRTLKIAGPLGLGICAVLYVLANIAYFSAATKVRQPHPFPFVVVCSTEANDALVVGIGRDRICWCERSGCVFQHCLRNGSRTCIECLCCFKVCFMLLSFHAVYQVFRMGTSNGAVRSE